MPIIPSVFVLIASIAKALPTIVRDAKAKIAAAKDPSSPDGAKVDAAEVEGIALEIAVDIGKAIVPEIAKANGVPVAA